MIKVILPNDMNNFSFIDYTIQNTFTQHQHLATR